ncbi:carbohydrate ABC transporter permease [Leifsonia sp. AG29]|uniref:carbohydrate ABC transporter permease n=1 Tax=Leifsonia sp. AG29 TaxID=2598860 RepID=UPI00131DB8D9|nr:sugar ABC transporter permease [Leifsonia sp. AG29]
MSFSEVGVAQIVEGAWKWVGIDNYIHVITNTDFLPALRATVLITLISTVSTVLGGLFIAAVLERNNRANLVTQGLLVFLWALPPLVVGFVWKFLLASDGPVPQLLGMTGVGVGPQGPQSPLTNDVGALLAVAMVVAWVGSAFASLIFRAAILGRDRSQIEAAVVDGASTWHVFRYITLPALRPAIAVQALLTVIYCFRAFDLPYVMTSGGPGNATTTLPYLAYQQSFGTLDFSSGSATAVICLAFVAVFATIYIRMSERSAD